MAELERIFVTVAIDFSDEILVELREISPRLHIERHTPNVPPDVMARTEALYTADFYPEPEQAPKLRWIQMHSAGMNQALDFPIVQAEDIIATSTSGIHATNMAHYCLMMMLMRNFNMLRAFDLQRRAEWPPQPSEVIAPIDMERQTVGIVGYGSVGRELARLCATMGMTVLACDPYIREEQVSEARIQLVGLRELLGASDYVSMHVPATKETMDFFDADSLKLMKRGARFINTAHGGVIKEALLAEALQEGRLGGVALDVWNEEPPFNSPLIGLDKVIHTPHIGDNTIEARQDLSLQIVRQVIDALGDRDYRNVVNMPLLPGLSYQQIRPYMQLAESIGALQQVLARSPVRRVAIEIIGDDMNGLIKPMTVGILKGLLSPILGESVSFVNAPLRAAQLGWQITQAKGIKISEYRNVITCQVTLEDGEEISIAGALLDRQKPYILQINDYRIHFEPRGHLLIRGSYDKPGVIGRVGSLMAENGINIASWHTGRAAPGGHTLTALTFDEALPESVMAVLRERDFIRHVHQLRI